MKKIVSTLLIVACLFVAMPAQAQLKFGLKGGLNLNKADFSGLNDNFKSENRAGFFIGPMTEFTVPIIGIGVDASLLYSQKGSKFTYRDNSTTINQHAIDIPINLKYTFGLGDFLGIFIAAGPDFSFNISNDNFLEELGELAGKDVTVGNAAKTAEVGVNVGVGVKLINHLQIGVNYNIPLTDSAKKAVATGEAGGIIDGGVFKSKNKMWQVSLAFMF